jgi:4-hydroxybenzoate polyprenyltransferase
VAAQVVAVMLVPLPLPARGVALAGVAVFGLHILWQMRQLNLDDPASCLHIFRSNRDAGALLGLFFATAVLL